MTERGIEMLDEHRGFVLVDGAVQSYVNLADPTDLRFGYTRHVGAVVGAMPAGPLAAVHVGGAGMTIPRFVAHTRPGSIQTVFEPDGELTASVLARFPMSRSGIRLDERAGRDGVATVAPNSVDLLVVDAFADHRIPSDLVTVEFFRLARNLLRGTGYGVANVVDYPAADFVGRVVRSLRSADASAVSVVGPKHSYFGNYTVVFGAPIEAVVLASADPNYLVWSSRRVATLADRSAPLLDGDSTASPLPPAESLGVNWTNRQADREQPR